MVPPGSVPRSGSTTRGVRGRSARCRTGAGGAARHEPRPPPQPVLGELTALVGQVVAEAEREGLWPAGLAVAVPGLVARDARTVVRAPNLDWHDLDLGPLVPARLPLTVDNEANFGSLAELWLGEATPRDFLHVSGRSVSVARWSWTGDCCAVRTASRANWDMCPCAPTDRSARAVGAAAWSSTPARRRCCARPDCHRVRTMSGCWPKGPRRVTRRCARRWARRGPHSVSR